MVPSITMFRPRCVFVVPCVLLAAEIYTHSLTFCHLDRASSLLPNNQRGSSRRPQNFKVTKEVLDCFPVLPSIASAETTYKALGEKFMRLRTLCPIHKASNVFVLRDILYPLHRLRNLWGHLLRQLFSFGVYRSLHNLYVDPPLHRTDVRLLVQWR